MMRDAHNLVSLARKMLILSVLLAFFVACESDTVVTPTSELVVVRGYLYAGEPVTDIQITGMFGLSSTDTIGPPIADAQVTLRKNGVSYRLTPSQGAPGFYHYTGTDLRVEAGDRFELAVGYFDKIATSATTIPSPPRNVTISADQLFVRANGRGEAETVSVNWQAEPQETFYFVTIKNTENALQPIDDIRNGLFGRDRTFRTRPIRLNSYQIRKDDLTYMGEHAVRIYRVNPEYANLYAISQQDSRNLSESESNVENGLGIFTGFSYETVRFTVRRN